VVGNWLISVWVIFEQKKMEINAVRLFTKSLSATKKIVSPPFFATYGGGASA